MSEVTNAILLGLSDQNIYDEVLYYTCYGNVSCYIDKVTEGGLSGTAATKIETKAAVGTQGSEGYKKQQYLYGDDARLADETPYVAAGNMRGVTITFEPQASSNKSTFDLAQGIINKFVRATDEVATDRATGADSNDYINATPAYATVGTLGTMKSGTSANTYLYNRVRATVGNKIELSSQTYRNSDYTVFIRMGTTGGNAAAAQDAIAVYGQWNGTNLIASVDPVAPEGSDSVSESQG